MKTGFLTVDYNDSNGDTFKGLKLNITFDKKTETKVFNSGDPIIDWFDYFKFLYNGEAYNMGIEHISHSSNVDHWFMDTDKYFERYFDPENLEKEFPSQDVVCNYLNDITKTHCRIVATKDMKNFQEVKEYYKLNKK